MASTTASTGNNNANIVKEAKFIYRLTFGNNISDPGTKLSELKLEQGVQATFTDDNKKTYYLTFKGIKINRRIYQPTKIEAEFDFLEQTTSGTSTGTGTTTSTIQAPSTDDVEALLLKRQVKVEIIHVNREEDTTKTTDYGNTFTVAENCYVYELFPQLKRENNTIVMSVKLDIFSMDKLMTLNKYSKAYVARKLGSGILKSECKTFGMQADDLTPIIATDTVASNLRFLTYNNNGTAAEFIHPYLVQYNESFYDFLARSANRYGEFLYFENGKLTIGLPDSTAITIGNFYAVTIQDSSDAPLDVSFYRRDSAKDGNGTVKHLNHTPVKKAGSGFPDDVFNGELHYNAEAVNDEYIFPLVKDKFTSLHREKKALDFCISASDVAMARLLPIAKTFLKNETTEWYIGLLLSVVNSILVDEAVDRAKIAAILLMTGGGNADKNENHITPWDELTDQSDGTNVTQFGTLNAAGWMTLDVWSKIHKHQEEQQRHTICIDMGTNYADVKLGQKIKVTGLNDTYTVIQVQEVSEEAWDTDYDRYGATASDIYSDRRSQKIYAIPSYTEDTKEKFVPPLLPTPAFRRSGAQTAFVTDNDDPKYQGRVRVMYPWQTKAEVTAMKKKSEASHLKMEEATKAYNDAVVTKDQLLSLYTALQKEYDDILAFLALSIDQRTAILMEKQNGVNQLYDELEDLNTQKTALETEKTQKEELIKDMEAIENPTEEQQVELEAEKAKLVLIQAKIDAIDDKKEQLNTDIKKAEVELRDYQAAHNDKLDGKTGKDKADYIDKDNPVLIRLSANIEDTKNKENTANEKVTEKKNELDEAKEKAEAVDNILKAFLKALSTPWIRVATPMATPGGGTYFRPRIGDEVLVDYDNGNIERPYVLGSLFSKNVLEPHELIQRRYNPESQWENVSMAMVSPNGHHITFTDPAGGSGFITNAISPGLGMYGAMLGMNSIGKNSKDLNGGIHIGDRYGVYEIEMLTHKRAISIKSPLGTVDINAFSGITISAPNGNVTIKGKNITLEAGNKITMNSGTNLPVPDYGDSPTKKTLCATIGKAIVHGTAGALTDMFVTSVVDLSLIRHVIEVYVRPVDGTMLLKSRKFLKLEAGLGNATVKRNRFKTKTSEKKESEEEFYNALNHYVNHISDMLDSFFDSYAAIRKDFFDKRCAFLDAMFFYMEDEKDAPNITQWAKDDYTGNRKRDFTMEDYNRDFKDHVTTNVIVGYNVVTDDKTKFEGIKRSLMPYYNAAYKLFSHCTLSNLRDYVYYNGNGDADFSWISKAIDNAVNHRWTTDQMNTLWKDKIAPAIDDQSVRLLVEPKDPFGEKGRTYFKRAFLLVFLRQVADLPENRLGVISGKYIYIGYDINKVTNPDQLPLDVDYWWKRQVDIIDRWSQNSLLRGLWDSTIVPFWERCKANFAGLKDKQVWDADFDGQILFSDREDATISFEGEGVHRETDANQGNVKHLKWMLRSLK